MDKQTIKKLYDALHLGHSMALHVAQKYHKEFEGQYPATHKILDDNVQQIREAITFAEHSISAQDEVLTDEQIDAHINTVLRPTGTKMANFTMRKSKDDLRAAMRSVIAAATPSPAVAVEPVAYLRFRAAQQWSGIGGHDIEHAEWYETCHAHEIGDDKQPAFPVYATPSPSLAVRDVVKPGNGLTTDMERELFGDGEAGAGED